MFVGIRISSMAVLVCSVLLTAGCPEGPAAQDGQYVVLAYNDLGMHCMNEDFSEMMILPPYNNLRAQVIYRGGEEPHIITQGVTVSYSIENNTSSADKTNFWDYAQQLFGVGLAPDVGLTGNGLSGTLQPVSGGEWEATGIPVTPINDDGVEDPYPVATVIVTKNGVEVARTQAVVPVSWEISCNLCHEVPGKSVATDILEDHDRLHGTDLVNQKPVVCGACHGQAPLGTNGNPSLSRAMHHAHAPRMAQANLANTCYACHPGVRTQCMRGVHHAEGMVCTDCHGDMTAVADPARSPWADEPQCGECHQRAGFEFEQSGKLFRESKGHHGISCEACHGSPHAIAPSTVDADNLQAIHWQGHAGVIDTCTVCHSEQPDDSFDHRFEGGDDGDDDEEEDDDKSLGIMRISLNNAR